jgi:hypothetical protein
MQTNHTLVRIAGTVADLKTSAISENFVFGSQDRAAGSAAAVGLAAGGLAGAATGAAISSGDAADKVTAFECTVNGQIVRGRFGEVTFADGDQIEAVGTAFGGELNALAVARPADRTIWMHPHCSRGTAAYRRLCMRWIPTTSIAAPALMFTVATFFSDTEFPPWWFQLASIGAGGLFIGVVFSLVAYRFLSFAKLSDQIFASLQFDDPASVDLPKRLSGASRDLSPEDRQRYHPWKRWVYKY